MPSRIGGKEVELRWEGTAASYQLQFEVRTPDGAVLQSEQILTAEKSFKLRPRPAAAGAKVSIELLARCAGAISSEPVRTTWFVPGST
ncbi:MAG: hypothetical protein JNM98_20175 [Rhodocyclaceae bacterium]|nr:hypothetical protein [Rhodocyclaceae bacterium]